MRIVYNNLVDTATLTASSILSGYPVTNLQDQRLSCKWISGTSTSQSVVIDLATAQTITTAAIISHNVPSSATIQANSTDSWTTPAVSYTITWNENMMLRFFTGQSYRYWRFVFDSGNISIGRLWLGNYITVDPSSLTDFSVTVKNNDTNSYNKNRSKYSLPGSVWRSFSLNFPPTGTETINNIVSMIDSAGRHSSVIFCNFDTIRDFPIVEPCYCSIVNDVDFIGKDQMDMTYTLSLEEDL